MSGYRVQRMGGGGPIIDRDALLAAGADQRAAANINGPSLLVLPDWIPPERRADPAARYYCYFAHHGGRSIRLAWAAEPEGPWTPWRVAEDASGRAGVLDMGPAADGAGARPIQLGDELLATGHIASPDVHLDPIHRRVVLYCHSPIVHRGATHGQHSLVATSADGLDFHGTASGRDDGHGLRPALLGRPYFRAFWLRDRLYAAHVLGEFAVSGVDRRSWDADPELAWTPPPGHEPGAPLWRRVESPFHRWFAQRHGSHPGGKPVGCPRHLAVAVADDRLELFYSSYDDRPERILRAVMDTTGGEDPEDWRVLTADEEVLRPELPWEGVDIRRADGAIEPSTSGPAVGVNQLRDPAILDAGGRRYLFYSGRGEEAIGLAQLLPEG